MVTLNYLTKVELLIVHHSASPRDVTREQIRQWHVKRGFVDIGYHLVIEGSGSIVGGRPFVVQGAHARGSNSNSLGICVVGNNLVEDHKWLPQQFFTLWKTIQALQEIFPKAEVIGHKDAPGAQTECPGLDINEALLDYASRNRTPSGSSA